MADVLGGITTGIYVLTVNDGAHCHGMSSSWVTQVSGEPPLLMAAVDLSHHSFEALSRTRRFGLNIVGVRGKALEDYFLSAAARRPDNLDNIGFHLSPELQVPWLDEAMMAIAARVLKCHVAGDHGLAIAEPVSVRVGQKDRPLTSLDLDYVYLGGRQVVARDRTGW